MQSPTRFARARATGRVGRHVVQALEADGHEVVPISRSHRVVISGEGLERALEGVEVVIDTATSPSPRTPRPRHVDCRDRCCRGHAPRRQIRASVRS